MPINLRRHVPLGCLQRCERGVTEVAKGRGHRATEVVEVTQSAKIIYVASGNTDGTEGAGVTYVTKVTEGTEIT